MTQLEYLGEWEMFQDDYGIDDYEHCPVCSQPMEWEECWNGCDDGCIDMYDDDPLWYDEDDVELCQICKGRGGFWVCPLAYTHSQ